MSKKLDLRDIIVGHLGTLRNAQSQSTSAIDIMVFYALPAAAALYLWWRDIGMVPQAINTIVPALAIFAGLLLNVLVLVHGILTSPSSAHRSRDVKTLLREIYSNLSYAIFISMIGIVLIVVATTIHPDKVGGVWAGAIYFLVGNFILTLFMILKRVHVLLGLEYKG